MKRKLLLTFISFIFIGNVFSQSLHDVVYLKNGSVIRGIIIEQTSNESIKIQTKDRNIFVFKFDEITSIKKEEAIREKDLEKIGSSSSNGLKHGINLEPSLILAPEVDGEEGKKKQFLTHAQLSANCQLNNYIALGIGAGFRSYNFEDSYVPLYGQFRVNFKNKPISPFLETSLGYGFALSEERTGGAMFNLAFGFAKKMNQGQLRFGLIVDIFDRNYSDDYRPASENDYFYYDNTSTSFGLKLGYSF